MPELVDVIKVVDPSCMSLPCSDRVTPIPTATNVMSRILPTGFYLAKVVAYLTFQTTTGTFTVDVKLNGTSIFSTLLTIDAGEKSSLTAAVPAVISTSSLTSGAELTIDVTDDADGTASGLIVDLIGSHLP